MKSVKIANFEQYAITDEGDVISLRYNRKLTPMKVPNGYLHVHLHMEDGRDKQCGIHRLVAEHFIPNPYHYEMVNHIDGDKTNNHVSNLEWCNAQQNMEHALKTGLCKGRTFVPYSDKLKWLHLILEGKVNFQELSKMTGRRTETLHKMLRTTAEKEGLLPQLQVRNKHLRKEAAIRILDKYVNNK